MAITAELRAFLSTLGHAEAGGVTEVCVFQGGKKPTHVGYFDNVEAAAEAIEKHDGRGNIFVTLNSAKRSLLARCNNHLVEGTYKNPAERTKDTEIHRDSWFLLDVDPKRPSGISSADEEKHEALEVAKASRDWLLSVGVPASAMLTGDSGNGAYVLVRLPDYEVTTENTATKKALTNFIADKFDTGRVEIDRTVFNPARLIGALGAMKVKGENTEERPHRRSSVRTIAGKVFDPAKQQRGEPFDLYALAVKILPPAEEKKAKQTATQSKNGSGDVWFDARLIAEFLDNPKTTGRGFTYYDCPGCGHAGKFYVKDDDGGNGCFEPANVCDWRKRRDRIREIARENGIGAGTKGSEQSAPEIREVCMSDIQIKPVDWLWKRRIARGALTLLEGIEGEGKSTVLCAIAGAVTCGQGLEDMVFDGPGNVLWLSAEDSPEHVLKPRLLAAGAEQSRVFIVGEAFTFDDKGAELVRQMAERRKPSLIVIDPIFAYAKGDPSKGADARAVTNKLKQIAEDLNCAIVLVRHVGKSKGLGDPRAAGLYSIEWRAAARSVLLCGSDPDNPQVRALTQSKNNLSPLADSIGYTLEEYPPGSEVSRAMWTGVSQLTAKRILAQVADEDEKAERLSAEDFLRDLLRTGEMLAAEVQTAARKNGIPERTLTRIKARMGIKSRNEGFGNKKIWYWRLPSEDEEMDAEEPETDQRLHGQTDASGHLKVDTDKQSTCSEKTCLDGQVATYVEDDSPLRTPSGHVSEKFPDNLNGGNGLPLDSHSDLFGHVSEGQIHAGNGNGIPFLITSEMRRRLYALKYSGPDINKMTPAEAHAILDAEAIPQF